LINALILPAAKAEARALDLPLNTPIRLTSRDDGCGGARAREHLVASKAHRRATGPPGHAPHMAKISDLNMLAMMGGQERTEAEWCELLTDAGYAGISNRPTGTPFSVIEATVR